MGRGFGKEGALGWGAVVVVNVMGGCIASCDRQPDVSHPGSGSKYGES
jgi:hypothetical protein